LAGLGQFKVRPKAGNIEVAALIARTLANSLFFSEELVEHLRDSLYQKWGKNEKRVSGF
jgi:hypothetical protein